MILQPVYIILAERLRNNSNLTANEVAWYLGQYQQTEENFWYTQSGIYLEFPPFQVETKGQNYQEAEMEVIVHFAQYCTYDDDQRILDPELDHLDQVDYINQEIQGAEAKLSEIPAFANLEGTQDDFEVFNDMELQGLVPPHQFSNVLVTKLTYNFQAFDKGNVKFRNWDQINASPSL